jgi:nucleoside phosphorylase
MSNTEICIITALREEAAGLVSRMKKAVKARMDDFLVWQGKLEGRDSVLLTKAVGDVKTVKAVDLCIESFNPEIIIRFGAAGAVSAELRIFDLIMPRKILKLTIPEGYEPTVIENAEKFVVDGIEIHSLYPEQFKKSPVIVTDVAGEINFGLQSETLRDWLGKELGIASVDWESYSMVKRAKELGKPACSFLVITDKTGHGAIEDFKKNLEKATQKGSKRLLKLLKGMKL